MNPCEVAAKIAVKLASFSVAVLGRDFSLGIAFGANKKRPDPLRITGARAALPQNCPRSECKVFNL